MALAWRVVEAMADHGVTDDQICERTGMSKKELARFKGEEGHPVKAIRLTTLDMLSTAIGCGIEELFKQVDKMPAPEPEPSEGGGASFWQHVSRWFGGTSGTEVTASVKG